MKSLSACFLTRNEEHTIGRAVRSVKPFVDEVIVADTHSDDRTAEAAAAAGATVVHFTWGDDFAAGRDYTVRQARGGWVLWMHGSEEFLPEGDGALRDCVGREGVFGYFVRIRNSTDDAKARAAETADLRLFRRRPDLPRLFVGRLHPHFHPDVLETVRREGLEVSPCDVVLRHNTEPGPPGPAKLRFNARLLEAELHDRPGQLHYLIEYGRTLLLMDDPRGHDVLSEAAARVMTLRDLPSPPNVKVQVLLTYLMTVPVEKSKANVSHGDARELAARWFPDSPNLLWTLAEQAFRRKEYADAARHLQRLLHLGRTGGYDRSHRFDPGILGEESLINLGACYLQMNKLEEAEACFLQLTTHPRFGQEAARMLALAQKWRRQGAKPR
jgi:hypothetical protein